MIKNLLRACSLIACRLTNETPVLEQNAGSALAVKMMPGTLVGAPINNNDEHIVVVGDGVGLRVFSHSPGMFESPKRYRLHRCVNRVTTCNGYVTSCSTMQSKQMTPDTVSMSWYTHRSSLRLPCGNVMRSSVFVCHALFSYQHWFARNADLPLFQWRILCGTSKMTGWWQLAGPIWMQ